MTRIAQFLAIFWMWGTAAAAEFTTAIDLPGERYQSIWGDFFAINGVTEVVAGSRPSRYQLLADGSVRRLPYIDLRFGNWKRFSLGEDLVEVSAFAGNLGGGPSRSRVVRINREGNVVFDKFFPSFLNVSAIKADQNGGFWLIGNSLRHFDPSGQVTSVGTTLFGSGTNATSSGRFAHQWSYDRIYRTELALPARPTQISYLPTDLDLVCLRALDEQNLVGLAARYVDGRMRYLRLVLDSPGFVTAIEDLGIDDANAQARCSGERAFVIKGGEVIMLDPSYRIQWRTQLPPNQSLYDLKVGPQGQAVGPSYLSSPRAYFTASGERLLIEALTPSFAGFAADGSLLLSRLKKVPTGERLQIQAYAQNDLQPLVTYDLPSPAGPPLLRGAALEADQLELLTLRSQDSEDRQHWQVSASGQASLRFQISTPNQTTGSVDRMGGNWISAIQDFNSGFLESRSTVGDLRFTAPFPTQTLTCEAQRCHVFGDGVVGVLNADGSIGELADSRDAVYQFLPAPGQRASLVGHQRVGRILNGTAVFGTEQPFTSAVQNADRTHWLLTNTAVVLADAFGLPLRETPCLEGCRALLDPHSKRIFMLVSVDETSARLQELSRDGSIQEIAIVPLHHALVLRVTANDHAIWLQSADATYAIDQETNVRKSWQHRSPVTELGHAFASQRSLTSVDYVNNGETGVLQVRRFEFEQEFRDGFE